MVNLSLQANVVQTLELLLSPRMLQMLKILHLPYLELVDRLSREEEENVMIEVERRDEYVEFLHYLTSDKKIKKEVDFTEMPGLENVSRDKKSLEEHLLYQLELEDLPEEHKDIAREIIGHLNDRGYLQNYPSLRETLMQKFNVSRPTVDAALKTVQTLEPEGVGARDLKECLLIQVRAYNFEESELENILERVIKEHLEDIGRKNFSRVAQALGLPESSIGEIADFIKNNLNPNPAASFGGEARQIIPSFAVEKKEKGWQIVNLETRYGPVIKFSSRYLKMLESPSTDDETKKFLRDRLKRAKELMEAFSKRSETLEKIVRRIIDSQEDFLAKGPVWLKPLSQKSLADEFGLHPSTISRGVAEKYIQTPQGLFPLKFLCPRGPKGMTAGRLKAMLAETISHEDKMNPLSDKQITDIMKGLGAKIDRRTVAYYRKELDIPTADERKGPPAGGRPGQSPSYL